MGLCSQTPKRDEILKFSLWLRFLSRKCSLNCKICVFCALWQCNILNAKMCIRECVIQVGMLRICACVCVQMRRKEQYYLILLDVNGLVFKLIYLITLNTIKQSNFHLSLRRRYNYVLLHYQKKQQQQQPKSHCAKRICIYGKIFVGWWHFPQLLRLNLQSPRTRMHLWMALSANFYWIIWFIHFIFSLCSSCTSMLEPFFSSFVHKLT